MTLKIIVSIVFLVYTNNVHGIAPAAIWPISVAVNLVAESVAAYLAHLVDADEELREEYTANTASDLKADDDRFLYLVVRDYIWDDSDATGYIDVETYQLDGSWQDYGYKIVVFDKRQHCEFKRNGDGGFRNWAYSNGWSRTADDSISYNPPKSPQLDDLIGDCVNIFNPHYYKYLEIYRSGEESTANIVTAETADLNTLKTDLVIEKSGDKYMFRNKYDSKLYCGEWTNYWMEVEKENKNISPLCEWSDNCYSIKSSYGYYDVDEDGSLNCDHTRTHFGEDNLFIIEPCDLFY